MWIFKASASRPLHLQVTKFSQLPNLHICITSSQFSLLAALALHLWSLAHPSTSSSLRITDCFFQYASCRLWNQLPASLCQPRTNLANYASLSSLSGTPSISSIDSPLSSSLLLQALNFPFLQILPTVAYLFFFWTDSMYSPDCLPILLSRSIFTL